MTSPPPAAPPAALDPEDDPGLARVRTRMAWARTAIALGALGVAVARARLFTGVALLTAAPLIWALGHYASRGDRSPDRRLLLVTATVTLAAVLAAVAALTGHGPSSLRDLLGTR